MGDVGSLKINDELERFVVIVRKNKEDLKTADDFLTYIYRKKLFEVYLNMYKSFQVLLTCPVSVAGANRSSES